MRRRLALGAVAVLVLVTGACSNGSPEQATPRRGPARAEPPPEVPLAVTPAPDPVTADFLADRTLHLSGQAAPVQLGASPHPALQGTLAPLVVPSPDGRVVAFSTYTETIALDPTKPPSAQGVRPGDVLGTPSIVVHDLSSGTEHTLVDGAYSPAWRADGALAYVQGHDPAFRAGFSFTGHVMVRPSVDGEAEQWTNSEGRYIVAGWAGSSLMVYHEAGNEAFDLEVVDGPGEVRTLLPGASLVALSPDGARAAVAVNANGVASHLEVVDVASGQAVAVSADQPLTSLVYAGSWVGSRIVARGGDPQGSLVAVFDTEEDSLRLQHVLRVDARLPNGLAEPRLDRRDPNRLTAWSFVPEGRTSGAYVLVRCDLAASSCVSGPPVPAKVVRLYG